MRPRKLQENAGRQNRRRGEEVRVRFTALIDYTFVRRGDFIKDFIAARRIAGGKITFQDIAPIVTSRLPLRRELHPVFGSCSCLITLYVTAVYILIIWAFRLF